MFKTDPGLNRQLIFNGALLYLFLAACALTWVLFRVGTSGLRARTIGPEPFLDVAIGGGVGVLVVLFSRAAGCLSRRTIALELALARLIGPASVGSCLFLALFSGGAEELFFRAALQPEVGLLWASVIFGLLHIPFQRDLLLWTIFAVVMGFVLGALYTWRGNALAPTCTHVLVNACNLIALQSHWRDGGALSKPVDEAPA